MEYSYPLWIIAGIDAKVYAVRNGTVVKNQKHSGYGYVIDIKDAETGYIYRYAHIAYNPHIHVGQEIKSGTKLSYISGSGTKYGSIANGQFNGNHKEAIDYLNKNGWGEVAKPHLHFEVRKRPNTFYGNSVVDPEDVFGFSMSKKGKRMWMTGGIPSVDPRTLIDHNELVMIERAVRDQLYASV